MKFFLYVKSTLLNLLGIMSVVILPLNGQFSPGELSKYHADLEGNKNCVQCHELRKKEISDGCVQCHSPLKERIDAGLGYHKDKSVNCGKCHSDHNGRDFELVYWPKDISNFKHDETGYTLTGKHRALKCNQCHTREFIQGKAITQWAEKHIQFPVLDRTFLGLLQTCQSCHVDVHREEVSLDCVTCHNTEGWKLAQQQFIHTEARFLLTGAHQNVSCEKCHLVHRDWDPPVSQLTGLSFSNCTPCHDDPHRGSYGPTCEACHKTTDWKKDRKPFDHSRTKYPLLGKHEEVVCTQCHSPDLAGRLPTYASCNDCHKDEHFGQFASRKDGGDCSPCHTVNGFKPTRFTIDMHQTSRFILDGSHLAVPCTICHTPFEPETGISTTRFVWENNRCENCHQDIHRNQFMTHFQNQCDVCHRTISFRDLSFDHQKTEFPLDGKHQNISCVKCHVLVQDSEGEFVRYFPVAHACADCHTLTNEIR